MGVVPPNCTKLPFSPHGLVYAFCGLIASGREGSAGKKLRLSLEGPDDDDDASFCGGFVNFLTNSRVLVDLCWAIICQCPWILLSRYGYVGCGLRVGFGLEPWLIAKSSSFFCCCVYLIGASTQ